MQINEKEALERLTQQGVKLPPQPRVLIELQKLLASSDYEMRSVARVIAQDPGITALLFRAARSPAFARAKNAQTLEQILMVVGVKQVFSLVQAASLSAAINDKTRRAFEIFWNRAHEIAQMASIIAGDRVSVCNVFPEQAYLAGIFHECGVPVLMMRFPAYCAALKLDHTCCWPGLSEEDAKFNVDHTTIGYLVARHWKLPDFVCAAIRYHHELPHDETGAATTLVCILQLAIHFYHRMNHQDDPLWAVIGPTVLAEIGLAADEESDYLDQITQLFLARND